MFCRAPTSAKGGGAPRRSPGGRGLGVPMKRAPPPLPPRNDLTAKRAARKLARLVDLDLWTPAAPRHPEPSTLKEATVKAVIRRLQELRKQRDLNQIRQLLLKLPPSIFATELIEPCITALANPRRFAGPIDLAESILQGHALESAMGHVDAKLMQLLLEHTKEDPNKRWDMSTGSYLNYCIFKAHDAYTASQRPQIRPAQKDRYIYDLNRYIDVAEVLLKHGANPYNISPFAPTMEKFGTPGYVFHAAEDQKTDPVGAVAFSPRFQAIMIEAVARTGARLGRRWRPQ